MEVVDHCLVCSELLMVNLIKVAYFEKYYQKKLSNLFPQNIY